jgi:type IV pilus assembly protein PilA
MLKKLIRKICGTKSGFTLIELIVVIAILAILAVVIIPLVSGQINKARDASAKSDLNSAYLACQMVLTNDEADGITYKVGTDEDKVRDKAKNYFKGSTSSTITGVTFEGTDGAEATGIKSVTITENGINYVYDASEDPHFKKDGVGF